MNDTVLVEVPAPGGRANGHPRWDDRTGQWAVTAEDDLAYIDASDGLDAAGCRQAARALLGAAYRLDNREPGFGAIVGAETV